MIAVGTKAGEIHRFDLAKIGHLGGGPVSCAGAGVSPLAVRNDGTIDELIGAAHTVLEAGEAFTVVTPTGGGYGPKDS